MSAETFRMLVLVRDFDDRFGWAKWSFRNCAETRSSRLRRAISRAGRARPRRPRRLDHCQVVVHVDDSALRGGAGRSDLPIETVKRPTCDGSLITIVEDDHWADGGATSIDNLTLLCSHHCASAIGSRTCATSTSWRTTAGPRSGFPLHLRAPFGYARPTHLANTKGRTMNTVSRPLVLLGAALASMLVIGCSPGGSGGGEVDDSPEATAFRFRQGIMRAVAWKVGQLRAMADGDVPADDAVFRKGANELVSLSTMLPEGFIPNSGDVEGSAALAEIWTNRADFDQKAAEFQMAAQGLADAANSGGFAAAQGLVQGEGQTCGGCHRPYRRRDE
jgi:cytochrome c556